MRIISYKIGRKVLIEQHLKFFPTLVKAAVDIVKGVMAIDAVLSQDLAQYLLKNGSLKENIWGVSLFPLKEKEGLIDYTSTINVRPMQKNFDAEIKSSALREKIKSIVDRLVDYES